MTDELIKKMTCTKCNRDSGVNSFKELFCKGCGKLVKACNCEPIPEKVSIIIPCYNAEKYIQNSIRNALRQTYENIEVIVVDDGSTDKTMLNLIRDPLASKIKIIEKENGGVGSAINAGIKSMTGNWFKWLSADDTLEKYAISAMMHHIKKTTNNQNKIFYTHYKIIDKNNKLIGKFIEPDRNDFDYLKKCAILFNNYYGNATTSMIHRSVFERAGFFDESLQNGEDYDFWLRCLFKHDIELHLVPEILACYRKHDNQLTKRRGVELYRTIEKIREKNISYLHPDMQKKVMLMCKQLDDLGTGVKIRRHARNLLFSLLPNKVNNKILSQYGRIRNRK